MALTLQLDTDELYDFFVLFDNLSPLRKRIWMKIVAMCRRWTISIPSQSTIAKWCKCSRSAVSEAYRIFQDYGWLVLQSRGWKRSKKHFISESKKQIDMQNRRYFKRVEATYRATHTVSSYKKNTSVKPTGEISIRERFKNRGIPLSVQLKLSMVTEACFEEAYFQCMKKADKGFKPDDECKYLCGVALSIAQKRGERLNWPAYYYTIGKKCNRTL